MLEGDDTLLQSAVNHHYKTLELVDDSKANQSSTDDSAPVIDFCMCNPPFFDTGE